MRIVLQARTSSNRLPAKVLLPIAGVPLAVICAQRLNSTGHEVVLATSTDHTDDVLSQIAENLGLNVFRGSLNDVLNRFLVCVSELADDDIVVRATADNPLPDGGFIDALLELFKSTKTHYLGTSSPADGLPYGLSAEVFYVGAIRAVAKSDHSPADLEHVTTSLRMHAGSLGIVPKKYFSTKDLSHMRVTIDTLEDYLAMALLFNNIDKPATICWRKLIYKMQSAVPASSLIL